jgi:hypothetical protein
VYRVSSNASLMCWRAFFNKSLKEQRPKKFDLCQKGTDTNLQKYPHEGIINYDYS